MRRNFNLNINYILLYINQSCGPQTPIVEKPDPKVKYIYQKLYIFLIRYNGV